MSAVAFVSLIVVEPMTLLLNATIPKSTDRKVTVARSICEIQSVFLHTLRMLICVNVINTAHCWDM